MMTGQPASTRKVVAGAPLGLGSAALVWLLAGFGWLEPLELKSYDWRIRQAVTTPPSVNPDIVMVGISDTSIRDLAPFFGRWPWPRAGDGVDGRLPEPRSGEGHRDRRRVPRTDSTTCRSRSATMARGYGRRVRRDAGRGDPEAAERDPAGRRGLRRAERERANQRRRRSGAARPIGWARRSRSGRWWCRRSSR